MRVLLDTHAWLWFVLGDERLSSKTRDHIENPANSKLISPASYWETAIKISIGKYSLPIPYGQFVEHAIPGQGFSILPILPAHTTILTGMPMHHRDPFDRLLVAQSLAEKLPLLSADASLDAYGIERVW